MIPSLTVKSGADIWHKADYTADTVLHITHV